MTHDLTPNIHATSMREVQNALNERADQKESQVRYAEATDETSMHTLPKHKPHTLRLI